ncbi:MAG TPA: cytochrome b N-terminal domain-containing protein [Blastocatellia bacterium]|nr:cytochrome b N-terminal domain-containing protein [Blastocatellia bacterium]
MEKSPSRLTRLYDWLDERTGVKQFVHEALDEPIRGGARFAYVFGSVLLTLFLLQVATGIFLTLYYVPSSDHAHASVTYIQKAVPGGSLLRGIHHYGASVMVIVAVLHVSQTFLFGAYKKKRELIWISGGLMLLLLFGFAFTGYLLSWDQAAYFGTKVGTNIAGEIPVVGPLQQRILLGGNDLTTLTLSRFFTTHVFLLPLGLAGLVALHLFLFRRAGPAGPYHERDDKQVDLFYPKQLFKDTVAIGLVFAVLVFLALKVPAELGPEADPTSDYLARPPWYFMPLFQLLKYFPGKLAIIPTVLLPGFVFGLLFLLPFIDRREERHPRRRPFAMFSLVLVLTGSLGLIALAKYEDRRDPEVSRKLKAQEEEMHDFFSAPFEPQQIGTAPPEKVELAGPVADPPQAYVEDCADCHGARGEGDSGPHLIGLVGKPRRSKDDLMKIMENARSYGLKKPMPKSFPEITAEDKQKIVEWLASLKAKK